MRLFEAIVEANHRALAGDASAGLHLSEHADALPIAALTCIDARLNPLFPEVLGVTKDHFIWLRNAGNIITSPLSSTTRSLSLACAIKGAKEIAIIGHSDCQVRKASLTSLTECFRALGIERAALPDNLTEFFGLFASEQQNVMKAVEYVRQSPLIGAKIPVHGLMVDIATGKLDWVVNGYQTMTIAAIRRAEGKTLMSGIEDAFKSLPDFSMGEMKFPDTKIGEVAKESAEWTSRAFQTAEKLVPGTPPAAPRPAAVPPPPIAAPPPIPRKIPVPPVVRPSFTLPKDKKFL